MPIYRVIVDGRDYTVEVPNPDGRPVQAIVDGQSFEVEVDAPPHERGPVEREAAVERDVSRTEVAGASVSLPGDGAVTIAAPLPGTIVSIGVSVGDRVEHGQELCVLEAMKMNNPIRATQAGVVKEVLVSVGQQVQHNHPLLVMTEV